MNITRWIASAGLLALALTPGVLAAQTTTGAITGTVVGDQGQPIEGAQIQVVNRSTGFNAGIVTRADGRYTVPGLEVGSNYAVTVRRIGFQPQTREPVTVTLGQATRVDFTLSTQAAQLGAVTVTAESDPVISPTRTGAQTTISDTAISRLPSLDRNFTDFVALTPQVSTTGPGLSGGGTNNRYNNIKIDGATEADLFGLGSTGQPGGQAEGKSISVESVKEYQVLLSPYDVRQGNFSGALINAVTKSGANELFGSAYIVGRNQDLTRAQPYLGEYDKYQYGFSLGGPIVRDRVLFFVNPEIQSLSSPASGLYFGAPGLNLTQANLDRFTSLLQGYGIPAGSAGQITNENPLRNIFARLDFILPGGHTLVLRHNYGYARDDNFSRASGGSTPFFPLSSNGYAFTSTKNATVAQLRSIFGNGIYNEFHLGYTTIRDRRTPFTRAPQVTAFVTGQAQLQAGADRFSHGNELDQDVLEITENLTLPAIGGHSITIGTQNQFYKPRNLFAQSTLGAWTFGNLDSLEMGRPREYIVGVPVTGDGSVTFSSAQYSGYIQDEWTVSPRLNLTFGLRADIPTFGDRPPENPDVLATFGRSTAEIPTGNLQWSPRFGFNFDVTGDQVNQLRGGAGLFTGRPAFVWLANAFQNSGLSGVALLTCRGALAPTLTAETAANPPQECTNGTSASLGAQIDLLNEDLKFPQNFRATLGYDRRVTNNWTVTLEGLYTRGVNNPFYQNLALAGPVGTDRNGRVLYGHRPFQPELVDEDRTVVTDVSNQSKDWSYQLTAGLQRQFRDNYSGSVFYTYSQVRDVQALTSSTAFSQYRFGRVWAGNQAETTPTRSHFEQRHKIVAYGTYTFPTLTDVTVSYIGGSGMPYSYISDADLNGDGITLNDPLYIPTDATDPNEILFQTYTQDGVTYTAEQQAQAFEEFISNHECLDRARGTIMGRNLCENPWRNEVNVSVRQSLQTFGFGRVTVQLDVFNFGNLLNEKWGALRSADINPQVTLLDQRTVTGDLSAGGQNVFRFVDPGEVYNSAFAASNYRMQLQLRYSF